MTARPPTPPPERLVERILNSRGRSVLWMAMAFMWMLVLLYFSGPLPRWVIPLALLLVSFFLVGTSWVYREILRSQHTIMQELRYAEERQSEGSARALPGAEAGRPLLDAREDDGGAR